MALGLFNYMHGGSVWLVLPAFHGVLYTMLAWWSDVIKESNEGFHTRVVQIGLRYGMILYIASVGDVLRRLVLGFLRLEPDGRRRHPGHQGRLHRRSLAADWHRGVRPVAPAAAQHADPADLGHDGHLGAPFADPRRPQGPHLGPGAHRHPRPYLHQRAGLRIFARRLLLRRQHLRRPPSSWRPASTASTSSSARSS